MDIDVGVITPTRSFCSFKMDLAVEDIVDRLSDEDAEQVASILLYRKLRNQSSTPRFHEMSEGEQMEKRAEYIMEINRVSKHHPELAMNLDFKDLEIERLHSICQKHTNMAKIEETYKKYRSIYEWGLRLGEMFLTKCAGINAIRGFAEIQIASDVFDGTIRDMAESAVIKKKPGQLNVMITIILNIAVVWICNTWGNGDVDGLKDKINGFFSGDLNPIDLLTMFKPPEEPKTPPPRPKRIPRT